MEVMLMIFSALRYKLCAEMNRKWLCGQWMTPEAEEHLRIVS
jgi:hypothetical protein